MGLRQEVFELTVTVLFDHLPDLQGEVRQKDVVEKA